MSVAADDRPVLRLAPAPDAEPPFVEDRPSLRLVDLAQQPLPLEWLLDSGVEATPRAGGLVLLRGRLDEGDDFGPVPTPRGDLPEPAPWAARLVQGIAEVLTLDRPATQLARWVSPDVYEDVRRRVQLSSHGHKRASAYARHRPMVRSVHVTEPADGVAEVCALVDDGRRARAYALRLEGADGRWRAMALDLV